MRALALSGGGAGGAYGAGALVGLGRAGERPQYDLVTAVSAGALIAPFAFLGPEWNSQLTDALTSGADRRMRLHGLLAVPFGVRRRTEALHALVNHYVTSALINAVAKELLGHRQTRHQGLERMFVNVGAAVGIGTYLALQSIDVPKFRCGGVGVQPILDTQGRAPAVGECVTSVKVPFAEALAIDLTGSRGGIFRGSGDAWASWMAAEFTHGPEDSGFPDASCHRPIIHAKNCAGNSPLDFSIGSSPFRK